MSKGTLFIGESLAEWVLTCCLPFSLRLRYYGPAASTTAMPKMNNADKHCAAGDQANETLLHEILEDSRRFNGYDVIIDDGGHRSYQMLASFKASLSKAQV